jgi:hypothetical protein
LSFRKDIFLPNIIIPLKPNWETQWDKWLYELLHSLRRENEILIYITVIIIKKLLHQRLWSWQW